MISRKSTFVLGIIIFLIPFLGLPTIWKSFLVVTGGLFLVISSISFPEPRKISKARVKKEKVPEIQIESTPVYPKDNIKDIVDIPEVKVEKKRSTRSSTKIK
jgi:uncharacterized protein (DUF58 family)